MKQRVTLSERHGGEFGQHNDSHESCDLGAGLQSAKGGDTHLVGMPKRVFLYVAIYDDGFSPCAKLENTMVLGALRTER